MERKLARQPVLDMDDASLQDRDARARVAVDGKLSDTGWHRAVVRHRPNDLAVHQDDQRIVSPTSVGRVLRQRLKDGIRCPMFHGGHLSVTVKPNDTTQS